MIINHLHCSGWIIGIVLLLFAAPLYAAACGNITAPDNWQSNFQSLGDISSTPITNCADPFGVTTDPQNPYVLEIAGQSVATGSHQTVVVNSDAVIDYRFTGRSHQSGVTWSIFRHVGEDLEYIKITPPEMTAADYITFAETYFSDPTIRALYIEIYESDNRGSYFDEYDPELDDYIAKVDAEGYQISERFYNFLFAAEIAHEQIRPALPLGTYTFVWVEYLLIESQRTWWEQVIDSMIPTAYAADFPPPNIYTQTITLTKAPPEPVGASSVLFLPGIQASRLYTDGVLGTEDQLWEPNINNDIKSLEMTEQGESMYDVYTRDVVDEIFGVLNVYKTFLSMLEDMKANEEIRDYLPFPYDWRYDVRDLVDNGTKYHTGVRSAIDEIEKLASTSFSGKVTIIAHSNGGLFAKALMIKLEERGIAHLVDKVIFIGTPQLGTPKAIGAILHGYGQQYAGGLISDDETARDVIRNMPGTYALLPSEAYFDEVIGPVVTNDDLPQTAYLDSYNNIDTYAGLVDFMLDVQNTREDDVSIQIPNTSNAGLLLSARDLHRQLDAWIAPSSTRVFEIAGVGIATIKGFEYKSFPCSLDLVSLLCLGGGYSKPSPITTVYGDETVVATSAVAYKGDKFTAYVDLFEEGVGILRSRFEHANLTESPTVKEYTQSILKFGYQNDSLQIPEDYIEVTRRYTLAGVHSPVDLLVTDSVGKRLGIESGVYYEEILGAQYIELADSRYVILPEGQYEISLSGYATGTFSVTLETVSGERTETIGSVFGASTTPSMVGRFTINDGLAGRLSIDVNGDDIEDYSADLETGYITSSTTTPTIAIAVVNKKSSGTRVSKLPKPQVAGISLSNDEAYYQKVFELLTLLQRYLELIKNKNEQK